METSFDLNALLRMHEKTHKSKPVQFVSVAGGVKKRCEISIKNRRNIRISALDKIRNLPGCESPAPISKAQKKHELRKLQLEQWKAEKEKKKKELSSQKKKPFTTGIPHNTLKFVPPPPLKPSTSGRVTRSQSKNKSVNSIKNPTQTEANKTIAPSIAPINAIFHPPVLKNMVTLPTLSNQQPLEKKSHANRVDKINKESKKTLKEKVSKQIEVKIPHSRPQLEKNKGKTQTKGKPDVHYTSSTSSSVESNVEEPKLPKSPKPPKTRTPRKSLQNQNMVTPKNVPKSESSSEEKLRSPKLLELPMTPEQISAAAKNISPYVTLSRGKDNARRERKQKLEEGLFDEDLCEMDSVGHFRRQLESEIARMTGMCETWDKISHQIALPESVQEAVLSAVGQARLLMSQKLQQFASLLYRCEHPTPDTGLVTPTDLHGFWDMVFMQIENVDIRFRKLEELRARGWSEEEPEVKPRRPGPRPARPVPAARPAAARPAASRIKDLIAAARKAKQSQVSEEGPAQESKTMDMGFFHIQSPVKTLVRTPLQHTPHRPALLEAVLSNEAEKSANKQSASLAMLRASFMARQAESELSSRVEHDLITFSPKHVEATPGRSILKTTPANVKKPAKKSVKVVLFNDSNSDRNNSIEVKTEDLQKLQSDRGLSSKDKENEMEKETKGRRRSKQTRKDAAEDRTPIMTRSRRKSAQTPGKEGTEGVGEENTLKEVNNDIDTPRRSTRKIFNN